MRRSDKLFEGMREGDLADLVLPLISVDEYEAKADKEECTVFGFYVHDKDAAADLNRFLQKSSAPLLDTEVSPAPDQHGYYMVFVELLDNNQLPETVSSLLAEIKNLVDIEDWQMRVRKTDGLIAFGEDNLRQALRKAKKADKHQDVLEFLKPSMLRNVLFEDDLIILEGAGQRHVFRFVEFARLNELFASSPLTESALNMSIRAVARVNRMRRMLGEGWDAQAMGRHIVVHHENDPRGLLLKPSA